VLADFGFGSWVLGLLENSLVVAIWTRGSNSFVLSYQVEDARGSRSVIHQSNKFDNQILLTFLPTTKYGYLGGKRQLKRFFSGPEGPELGG